MHGPGIYKLARINNKLEKRWAYKGGSNIKWDDVFMNRFKLSTANIYCFYQREQKKKKKKTANIDLGVK